MLGSPESSASSALSGSAEPLLATPTKLGVHKFTPKFAAVEERLFQIPTAPQADLFDRFMGPWLVRLCWFLLSVSLTFTPLPDSREIVEDDFMVPKPWDKRYVQVTENTGWEVALVRKGRNSTWIVLLPDRSLKSARLTDRKTILNNPKNGTYFQPLGPLSTQDKAAVKAAADYTMVEGREAPAMLERYQGGGTSGVRRFFALLCAIPVGGGSFIRWMTRRPIRMVGAGVTFWIAFEILQALLIFEMVEYWSLVMRQRFNDFLIVVMAMSETLKAVAGFLASMYKTVEPYVTPWKLLPGTFASFFLTYYWFVREEDSAESEHSSEAPSSAASTPLHTPRDAATREQLILVEQLTKRQEELKQQIIEDEATAQAREMAWKARMEVQARSAWSPEDRASWKEMKEKLETFSKIVEEDKAKRTRSVEEEATTPNRSEAMEEVTPEKSNQKGGSKEKVEGPEQKKFKQDVTVTLQKLDRLSQNPTQIYRNAAAGLQNWDTEFIQEHFPPGYQARVAPEVFAEIYSHGKRAREFFQEWLRVRTLLDCHPARRLLACGTTLDMLVIDEPLENFINSLTAEKLGKEIYGLMRAYEYVGKESDWKKPTGGSKNWVSKVNWEAAKRVDPELKADHQVPRIREQEDETAKEMDREAALLRVQDKLAEAAKKNAA